DLGGVRLADLVDDPVDHRSTADRQQLLRDRIGERPETRRVSGRQDQRFHDLATVCCKVGQVPSSHEARYFACSSVNWSIAMPIVSSFRRAISASISGGTGYTFRSSSAACWIAYSADNAWFAKDMSITSAGCPSADDRFTSRPSATR